VRSLKYQGKIIRFPLTAKLGSTDSEGTVMFQTDPPRSPREVLPTMYDLPSEDPEEPGLPDQFHLWQPRLLDETFRPPTHPDDQIFVATGLNLYYDLHHPQWYKRPDWFAAVGVSRLYEGREPRLSYVIWQEGVDPFIVVELLPLVLKRKIWAESCARLINL
jgi:Uma2 family endonuclease